MSTCQIQIYGDSQKWVQAKSVSQDVLFWLCESPTNRFFRTETGIPKIYEWDGDKFVEATENSDPNNTYFVRDFYATPYNKHSMKVLSSSVIYNTAIDTDKANEEYLKNRKQAYKEAYELLGKDFFTLTPEVENRKKLTTAEKYLNSYLVELGNRIGVKFVLDSNLKTQAAADLVNKIIYFKNQESGYENLAEELSHIMVDMIKAQNTILYNALKEKTLKSNIYKNIKKEYKNYYTTEEQFIDEAIGKLFAKYIRSKNKIPWKTAFFSWLKAKFKEWESLIKAYSLGYKDFIFSISKFESYIDFNSTYTPSEYKLYSIEAGKENTYEKSFKKIINYFSNSIIEKPYKTVSALVANKKGFSDTFVGKRASDVGIKQSFRETVDFTEKELEELREKNPLVEMKRNVGILVHAFIESIIKDHVSKKVYAPSEFEYYFQKSLTEYDPSLTREDIVKFKKLRPLFFKVYESIIPSLQNSDDIVSEMAFYSKNRDHNILGRVDIITRKGGNLQILDFKVSFNHKISHTQLEKAKKQLSLYKALLVDTMAALGLQDYFSGKPYLKVSESKVLNFVVRLLDQSKIYDSESLFKSPNVLDLNILEDWLPDIPVDETGLEYTDLTSGNTPTFHEITTEYDEQFVEPLIPNASALMKKFATDSVTSIQNKIINALELQLVLMDRILNDLTSKNDINNLPTLYGELRLKKVKLESMLDKLSNPLGDAELREFLNSEQAEYLAYDIIKLGSSELAKFVSTMEELGITREFVKVPGFDFTSLKSEDWNKIYYFYEVAEQYSKIIDFLTTLQRPELNYLDSEIKSLISVVQIIKDFTIEISTKYTAQEMTKGYIRPDIYTGSDFSENQIKEMFYTPDTFFYTIFSNFTSSLHSRNNLESTILRLINQQDSIISHNVKLNNSQIEELAKSIDGNYNIYLQVDSLGRLTGNIISRESAEFFELMNKTVQEPGADTKEFIKNSAVFITGDLIKIKDNKLYVENEGELILIKNIQDILNASSVKNFITEVTSKNIYTEEEIIEKIKEGYLKANNYIVTYNTIKESLIAEQRLPLDMKAQLELFENTANPQKVVENIRKNLPVKGNASLQFITVANKDEAYKDAKYEKYLELSKENPKYKEFFELYKKIVLRYRSTMDASTNNTYAIYNNVRIPEAEASIIEWISRELFAAKSSGKIETSLYVRVMERIKRWIQSWSYVKFDIAGEHEVKNSIHQDIKNSFGYMLRDTLGKNRKSYDLSKVMKKMVYEIHHKEGVKALDSQLRMMNIAMEHNLRTAVGADPNTYLERLKKIDYTINKRLYKTAERVEVSKQQALQKKKQIQYGTTNVVLIRDPASALSNKFSGFVSMVRIGWSAKTASLNLVSSIRNYIIMSMGNRDLKFGAVLSALSDVAVKGLIRRYERLALKAILRKPISRDYKNLKQALNKQSIYLNLFEQLGLDYSGSSDYSGYNIKGVSTNTFESLTSFIEEQISPYSLMRGSEMIAAVIGAKALLKSMKYEKLIKEFNISNISIDLTEELNDEKRKEIFDLLKDNLDGEEYHKSKNKKIKDTDTHVYIKTKKGVISIEKETKKVSVFHTKSYETRLYSDKDTGLALLRTKDGREIKVYQDENLNLKAINEEDQKELDEILLEMAVIANGLRSITSKVQGEFMSSTPIYGKRLWWIKIWIQLKTWFIAEIRNRFGRAFYDPNMVTTVYDETTGVHKTIRGGYREGYYRSLFNRLIRRTGKKNLKTLEGTSSTFYEIHENYRLMVAADLGFLLTLNQILIMAGEIIYTIIKGILDDEENWERTKEKALNVLMFWNDPEIENELESRREYELAMIYSNIIGTTYEDYKNNIIETIVNNIFVNQGAESASYIEPSFILTGDSEMLSRWVLPAIFQYLGEIIYVMSSIALEEFLLDEEDASDPEYSTLASFYQHLIPQFGTLTEGNELSIPATPEFINHLRITKDPEVTSERNSALAKRERLMSLIPILSAYKRNRNFFLKKDIPAFKRFLEKKFRQVDPDEIL